MWTLIGHEKGYGEYGIAAVKSYNGTSVNDGLNIISIYRTCRQEVKFTRI
jgi:hypothetical protein